MASAFIKNEDHATKPLVLSVTAYPHIEVAAT